jgi:general secretion pathway protein D
MNRALARAHLASSRAPRILVALLAALACLALASCAGLRDYEEGRLMMIEGDAEAGLAKLEEAAKAHPENKSYRRDFEQQRKGVVARYVSEGDMYRSSLQFDLAATQYQRALKWDPENARAKAGLEAIAVGRGQASVIAQARQDIAAGRLEEADKALRRLLEDAPSQREARDLLNRIGELRADIQAQAQPAALKGPFTQPITLEFRDASMKSVFEVVSRSSGINFVFDRDVRSDTKVNIFVRNTSLDDVIKLILLTNQLERKLLNENTVLIYPNTPAKQKEYKDLVVRSFYLANADVKQALNLVKGMVKTPDVFIDEKLNMMVVKDTPDAVRLIGNLVRAMDLSEPEVMLELEVMEVSRQKLTQLGIQYPEAVSVGKVPSAAGGGGVGVSGGTTSTDVFVIGQDNLKAFTINPPLVLNLKAQDSSVKVLANPRIRVKNREKAKVHIGNKVPVITTTSTANVGVSSSVSYLDVGLKLDVEPTIYLRDEVAIKVGLEVSNINNTLDLQGTRAYELGTRNTATVLQLRDGETQILAGLINDEDRRSSAKVPGLGDFPVLGRLFRNEGDDRRKTEIVLLITPRIVRTLAYPQSAAVDLPVGTDAAIGTAPIRIAPTAPGQLSMAPSGPGGGTGAGPRGIPGVPGVPNPPPGAAVPVPVPGVPPGTVPPGVPQPGQPGAIARPGATGGNGDVEIQEDSGDKPDAGPSTLLMAAPLSARSGSDIVVSLSLAPGGGATRATAELSYDPLQLEAVGAPVSSPGRVPVRIEGSAAVRFRVLVAGGRAQVRIDNVVGQDRNGGSVPVNAPGPVEIAVQ